MLVFTSSLLWLSFAALVHSKPAQPAYLPFAISLPTPHGVMGAPDAQSPIMTPGPQTNRISGIEKRQAPGSLIGWWNNSGSYQAHYCSSTATFKTSSSYGACCSTGRDCFLYTACIGSILTYSSGTSSCPVSQGCKSLIWQPSLGAAYSASWVFCATPAYAITSIYALSPGATATTTTTSSSTSSSRSASQSSSSTTESTTSSSPTGTGSIDQDNNNDDGTTTRRKSKGGVIGAAIGGVLGGLALIAGAIILFLWYRKRKQAEEANEYMHSQPPPAQYAQGAQMTSPQPGQPGFAPQGYGQQNYSPQGYMQQPYPLQEGYSPQGYPPQAYNPHQAYPQPVGSPATTHSTGAVSELGGSEVRYSYYDKSYVPVAQTAPLEK